MSLDAIKAKFKEKIAAHPEFRAVVKFDMGADGVLFVDTTKRPAVLSEDDAEATLTLGLKKDLLEGFLQGTKDPNIAYMTGKLKIRGPMGLAMKLNAFLED